MIIKRREMHNEAHHVEDKKGFILSKAIILPWNPSNSSSNCGLYTVHPTNA
jgi:hypothetical protein